MMENKSLDDIFSELAEKYSGSTNIKKEAADIKNNFMNVNKANISSHSVGNLQSPVNITGEKLPELFTGKNSHKTSDNYLCCWWRWSSKRNWFDYLKESKRSNCCR